MWLFVSAFSQCNVFKEELVFNVSNGRFFVEKVFFNSLGPGSSTKMNLQNFCPQKVFFFLVVTPRFELMCFTKLFHMIDKALKAQYSEFPKKIIILEGTYIILHLTSRTETNLCTYGISIPKPYLQRLLELAHDQIRESNDQ